MNGPCIGIGEVLWDVFPDQERFGGAPANFACSLAELAQRDAEVFFLGAVGDDDYGRRGVAALQERGVLTHAMQTTAAATGRVTVQLDAAGAAVYEFDPLSAWDLLDWTGELEALAESCSVVCFGTLGQRRLPAGETIRRFVQRTSCHALRVLDINLRPPFFADSLIRDSLGLANVLKLNEVELPRVASACQCQGSEREIVSQLAEKYSLGTIAVTKGGGGALLYSLGRWSEQPSPPIEVVDTVGAGDAYTAALVMGLLLGDDVESINRKAIQVAGYVCTQPGATMTFPFTYRQLESRR